MHHSLDMVFTIAANGRFIQVNKTGSHLLGYTPEELTGQEASNFISLKDSSGSILLDKSRDTNSPPVEAYIKSGTQITPITWSTMWYAEENCFFCIASLSINETDIRWKEEISRLLEEQGSETHALLDQNGHYLYGAGNYLRQWGYNPAELLGTSVFEFIHPEDIEKALRVLGQLLQTKEVLYINDVRFRAANGSWRWVQASVSNQLENPLIKALFLTSTDITDQKVAELQVLESEQRFRSLFENNLDMVVFQDEEGMILDANASFLAFSKKQREEVINHYMYEFLPPETVEHSKVRHLEAFSGSKVHFELEMDLKGIGLSQRVLSIMKVPFVVAGKITAVHGVIRDITPERIAQRTVEQQAVKLNTILESITEAFFALDKDWNFTFANTAFIHLLRTSRHNILGKNIWKVSPDEIGGMFYQQFQQAMDSGKAVYFEAYLKRFGLWLEIKAFPSDEGLSVYINNITERVKANKELEKLSHVARKTSNAVVITDADGKIEWVNEGFTRITGYSLMDVIGKKPSSFLIGPQTDWQEVQRVKTKVKQGDSFNSMLMLYRKSGEPFWISMDISTIFDKQGNQTQYFAILKDVSERKASEEQLVKMTQDLYRHNSDMQQFTYIISHNLRSPLTNAQGFLEILFSLDKNSDMFDASLGYLRESINRLDEVLKDINKVLVIRDKRDAEGVESIKVADVWEQALNDQLASLRKCNGQLEVHIEDNILVQANRAYLHSIFHNLMSNAIKYRSEERTLQIVIEATYKPTGGVLITFSDNGSGFEMAKVGKDLFKMYKRFHTEKDGKGIGLFLVKTHVEAMGGQIAVSSQVNVGTTFTIQLNEGAFERPY